MVGVRKTVLTGAPFSAARFSGVLTRDANAAGFSPATTVLTLAVLPSFKEEIGTNFFSQSMPSREPKWLIFWPFSEASHRAMPCAFWIEGRAMRLSIWG